MQLPSPELLATLPQRNEINPETRGPAVVIANGIGLAVATIAVGIRIYTRVFITRNFGWDDTFILLALVDHTFH